jgi:hypothetical protein
LNLRGRSTIEKFLVFFEGGEWSKYWGVSGASNKPEVAVWRKGAAHNEISKSAVWGGKKQIRRSSGRDRGTGTAYYLSARSP